MACTYCLFKRKHKIGDTTYYKCQITGQILTGRYNCPHYVPRNLYERIVFWLEKRKSKQVRK